MPIIRGDRELLRGLLETMFQQVWDGGDEYLERRVGERLYRFYEGCGLYEEARGVISKILERAENAGDRIRAMISK